MWKYLDLSEAGDALQDPGQSMECQIAKDNLGPGFVGTDRHGNVRTESSKYYKVQSTCSWTDLYLFTRAFHSIPQLRTNI